MRDFGAKTAAEFAELHEVFRKADEFYRYYREALLNEEGNQDQSKPAEWIPISNH